MGSSGTMTTLEEVALSSASVELSGLVVLAVSPGTIE